MKNIISKILEITNDQLDSIDLSAYKKLTNSIDTPKEWFYLESGREHYRLIAYISTLFQESQLLDIGTYQGSSSIAMSYNSNNSVISFDVNPQFKSLPTVSYFERHRIILPQPYIHSNNERPNYLG